MAVIDTVTPSTYELVAVDTYRDIHKGIRADLFDLTGSAGRIDPSCPADVADLARHVDQTVDFLVVHAGHEDTHLVPVMSELLPDLNATIQRDHAELEGRLVDLQRWARTAVSAPEGETRGEVQRLYVELASFTSAYLAHQDLEERVVAPELHRVIGADGVLADPPVDPRQHPTGPDGGVARPHAPGDEQRRPHRDARRHAGGGAARGVRRRVEPGGIRARSPRRRGARPATGRLMPQPVRP